MWRSQVSTKELSENKWGSITRKGRKKILLFEKNLEDEVSHHG